MRGRFINEFEIRFGNESNRRFGNESDRRLTNESHRRFGMSLLYHLLGLVDQTLKAIFVTRTDVNSRQQCYNEILRRVESEDEWPTVLIFPEGHYY
jgi:hypothetical protein